MSNDKYRKAIYNAQVAMNTGAVTYEQAVDIACKDMLNAGLNCVEYKTVQDTPCPTMRIWQLKPQTSVLICVVRAKQEPNGECRLLWSIQDRAVAPIVQNISAKCLLTMCIQTAKVRRKLSAPLNRNQERFVSSTVQGQHEYILRGNNDTRTCFPRRRGRNGP